MSDSSDDLLSAHAELRERLAAIVESSDDAILSKTLDGIIVTWNGGATRVFGWTAEEVVGKPITILIPEDRLDEEPKILERLRRGERIDHYETVRVRKDGVRIDVSLTASPIRGRDGRVVGASKVARDISERGRIETALREETRILELLNETGALIASALDLETVVQSVTDAATRVSGAKFGAFFYNVTSAEGESFLLYTLSGASRESFERFGLPRNTPVFEPTFRGEGVVRSDDITTDPRYGTMSPHRGMPKGHLPVRSYLAVPVISRSGDVIGGLFFGHPDVGVFSTRMERIVRSIAAQASIAIDNARLYETAQRAAVERERMLENEQRARAEAERLSTLKDDFLATLSHELRTPLNAILGWAQLLRDRPAIDVERGLAVIERNARAQTQLVEDLLDMSRIVSGKVRLEVQRLDLGALVRSALESLRHSADARGVRVSAVLDPDTGAVRGDPGRLEQCVWNLLSNAIKFTPKGGQVHVTLARVDSHVEISVVDTGEGIDPEFLPFVFERFRQGDSSSSRSHGGLGLGLAIVKSLVDLHGGGIRAQSEGKGRGSTFTMVLPQLALRDGADVVPSRRGPGLDSRELPTLGDIRVLVVEDERDSRELIQFALEACGARVATAGSGREALGLLSNETFDVIVSDIGMPEMDGYELIHHIRALPASEGGRTPAAALTAFVRTDDRTRALRAGFQIHVAKPVDPNELATVVASLAARRPS